MVNLPKYFNGFTNHLGEFIDNSPKWWYDVPFGIELTDDEKEILFNSIPSLKQENIVGWRVYENGVVAVCRNIPAHLTSDSKWIAMIHDPYINSIPGKRFGKTVG